MSVITFNQVSEKYRIKFINNSSISWEEVWALEDINFKLNKGEVLGIIGHNGSGKTTFLKLIAGMLIPDKGDIVVNGKVSVLMELGAGFNPEFTGRENIVLNAKIYGLDEEVLKQQIENIIAFADLGKFIDAPIKYYSQGMYMRLAFALAIFVEPDILLLDEILSVGDEDARQKCIKKIFELKEAGKTIVLVSHDLDIVGRLCSRVILLEKGRIVKDGQSQKVMQNYLEKVGSKEGMAVLEKDKKRLVFNNGKINISYDGSLLTKMDGGYVAFFNTLIHNWFSSSNLFWKVKQSSQDEIVAEGASTSGTVVQIWTLQLLEDELRWKVEMLEKTAKQSHIDLLFMSGYCNWLTLEKEGVFPSFMHKLNWHELGVSEFPKGLLAIKTEEIDVDFPGIVFEMENDEGEFKILNTGYAQESRVVQVFLNTDFISVRVKLFPERNQFTGYIDGLRLQLRAEKAAEEERLRLERLAEEERLRLEKLAEEERILKEKKAEEERLRLERLAEEERIRKEKEAEGKRIFSLRNMIFEDFRLFVDADNKVIRIYYRDNEITAGNGLYMQFSLANKWYYMKEAKWQIERESKERLTLIAYYEELFLSYIWVLNYLADNTLEFKIEMITDKQVILDNQSLRLEVKDEYRSWQTPREKGDFIFTQYVHDIMPIRLKDSKVPAVVLRVQNDEYTPQIFFENSYRPEIQVLSIFKQKENMREYICLGFSTIITQKNRLINIGRSGCFTGKIALANDIKLEDIALPSLQAVTLNNGDLRFIFEQGRGRIFWRDKELTKGLSIYASLRCAGIWYDSSQAAWEIKQQVASRITILGDWPHIPVSQLWDIEVIDKNTISWKVSALIHQQVNLEIEQACLMLSSEYNKWFVPRINSGKFINEYTEGYDIIPFRFWYGKTAAISIEAENLPRIVFRDDTRNDILRGVIENSDHLYSARLLQFQKANIRKLSAGEYLYFNGLIKIDTDA